MSTAMMAAVAAKAPKAYSLCDIDIHQLTSIRALPYICLHFEPSNPRSPLRPSGTSGGKGLAGEAT